MPAIALHAEPRFSEGLICSACSKPIHVTALRVVHLPTGEEWHAWCYLATDRGHAAGSCRCLPGIAGEVSSITQAIINEELLLVARRNQ